MIDVAYQFASLIDNKQFDEAAALLAEDCSYSYREGSYTGRKNIINIYKMNHLQVKRMFDEIRYSSEVELVNPEKFKIHFTDEVRLGDAWHTSRFDQLLRFEDGQIVEIQDIQLPGEEEAFREFYQGRRRG